MIIRYLFIFLYVIFNFVMILLYGEYVVKGWLRHSVELYRYVKVPSSPHLFPPALYHQKIHFKYYVGQLLKQEKYSS